MFVESDMIGIGIQEINSNENILMLTRSIQEYKLDRLHDDLLYDIASRLSVRDIRCVRQVNKGCSFLPIVHYLNQYAFSDI
jgi:hypothetical protein